jgi:hypothetical protein
VDDLEMQNRVHPAHDVSKYKRLTHQLVPLKEGVVEGCRASSDHRASRRFDLDCSRCRAPIADYCSSARCVHRSRQIRMILRAARRKKLSQDITGAASRSPCPAASGRGRLI